MLEKLQHSLNFYRPVTTANIASNPRLGKIDMADDTNRSLLERFDVLYYPNFKIFRNGVEVLGGSRLISSIDAAQFVEYLMTEKAKEVSISVCFLYLQRSTAPLTFSAGNKWKT